MNTYTPYEIARMIDISAVRADSTLDEVRKVADAAKKYGLSVLLLFLALRANWFSC